jgi:hypothetical protein
MSLSRFAKANLSLMRGVKTLLVDELVAVRRHEDRRTTAASPRHDDLYVVSFPKSGATWMNFLMANLHLRMSGLNRKVTFFNVHDVVPDIQSTRDINQEPLPFPGYRVMKSHAGFNPNYLKVIYLVRDPRDALISYFHFLQGLGQFDGSLSQLVRSEQYGVAAWARHVEGWLKSPASLSIDFVRYEDLLRNPRGELLRVYGLLGHELDDDILEAAIEASSFEKMKTSEQEWNYGRRPDIISKNLKFMRSGKSGEGKNSLSAEDLEFIADLAKKYMQHFAYD